VFFRIKIAFVDERTLHVDTHFLSVLFDSQQTTCFLEVTLCLWSEECCVKSYSSSNMLAEEGES